MATVLGYIDADSDNAEGTEYCVRCARHTESRDGEELERWLNAGLLREILDTEPDAATYQCFNCSRPLAHVDGSRGTLSERDYPHGFNCPDCRYPEE